MSQRDIHKPSTFDPAQYEYIDSIYTGPRGLLADGWTYIPLMSDYEIEQRREINRNQYRGNFKQKGTCDHCGSYFHYGAIFKHSNGDLIVVGHICADEAFGHDSRRSYDKARLAQWIAGCRHKGRIANMARGFLDEHKGLETALETDHDISRDLLRTLNRFGYLTEKQVELALRIPAQIQERKQRELRDAAEAKNAPDWQNGKQRVSGKILTTRWHENAYGETLKMLVKLPDGRKCWGSVPRSIQLKDDSGDRQQFRGPEDYKDSTVEFEATFAVSDKDAKFAFFKRPTKAQIQ